MDAFSPKQTYFCSNPPSFLQSFGDDLPENRKVSRKRFYEEVEPKEFHPYVVKRTKRSETPPSASSCHEPRYISPSSPRSPAQSSPAFSIDYLPFDMNSGAANGNMCQIPPHPKKIELINLTSEGCTAPNSVNPAGDDSKPPLTESTAVFSPYVSPPARQKFAAVINLVTPSPVAVAMVKDKVTYYPAEPPRHRDSRVKRYISRSFGDRNTGSIEWKDGDICMALTLALRSMVEANESAGFLDINEEFPCFYSEEREPHGLSFYVDRLIRHSNCSTSVYIIMFEYVKRIQKECKLFITSMNFHRIVLTCLLLAAKFVEDEVFSNDFYSNIGGISVEQLNDLEVEMLYMFDWNASVSTCRFAVSEKELADICKGYKTKT